MTLLIISIIIACVLVANAKLDTPPPTTAVDATTIITEKFPPSATPLKPTSVDFEYDYYVPFRSDAHDKFSWQLTKQILTREGQKNLIISPYSVKLMLSILSEAAGNNTKTQTELISTLTDIGFTENLRNFYKKNLLSLRQKNPYYTLNLATKIFTDKAIEPQQRFAALLHDYYDTDIERLNFKNVSLVTSTINDWCSEATVGRLRNLVNEGNLVNSVMIMANVIYFNGVWTHPFEESFDGVFFRTAAEQVRVHFMEITEYFYYHNSMDLDAKMLRLPYKGRQYSMFILLPKSQADIQQLIDNLANDKLKRMQLLMEDTKVKVTMPKFKFDFDTNLVDTLKELGISEIFTDNASLPGLARGSDVANILKVDNMFQKAGIEVNENGTEVFAATVVEIGNKFGGVTIIEEFNVNRPFLFFIEEESTGNILFAGKVMEPSI